ncbi:MAG: glycogen/starch/alpha-glucan phosphorylase, partial [Naasia sp.]
MTETSSAAASLRATHPLALAPVAAPAASVDGFVKQFLLNLNLNQGVALSASHVNDRYLALAATVRDYLMPRWLDDRAQQVRQQAKTVCYLSAEYLLGRQLDNNLLASRLTEIATEALAQCGIDIDELRDVEIEPGLGNGGLGRLAACFVDSLATMSVPTIGYGIRYEYGIFRQAFADGEQIEQPDAWLRLGSPWDFAHPEAAQTISFGGRTETYDDADGTPRTRWI